MTRVNDTAVAASVQAPTLGSRDRQRLETRERLYCAAVDEIRREGIANAQVDRIVAAVGVSRGTFYFHFPTKEEVLLEWLRRRQVEIVAGLERTHQKPRTLRDALLEIVAFLVDVTASRDGRLVLETLALHVREGTDPRGYLVLDEIERLLAAAAGRDELRRDVDARHGAVLFLSNVFGFLVSRTASPPPHPSAELLVDVFLTGVTALPGRGRTRASTATRLADHRGRPRRNR